MKEELTKKQLEELRKEFTDEEIEELEKVEELLYKLANNPNPNVTTPNFKKLIVQGRREFLVETLNKKQKKLFEEYLTALKNLYNIDYV